MLKNSLNNHSYLVLGIGTDIGKTHLVANLCKNNAKFRAIKPIITGFTHDNKSDSAKILLAQNKKITTKNLDDISPWRFTKAVSPNFISDINFDDLLKFCKKNIDNAIVNNQTLIIEGVGGAMSPFNNKYNFLDLASKLNIPILLVTANYLGAISHTLCCLEAIKNKNLKISHLIINDFSSNDGHLKKPVSDLQFIKCLKNFTNCNIIKIKFFIKKSCQY